MRKRPRNPCKPYRSNVAYIHVPTSKYFVCPPTMWSSSFNPINVFQILISPTRVNMTRHHIFNFRSAGSTVPFLVTVGSLEHPSLPGYRDESLCAMCDFIFHRRLLAIKKKKKGDSIAFIVSHLSWRDIQHWYRYVTYFVSQLLGALIQIGSCATPPGTSRRGTSSIP